MHELYNLEETFLRNVIPDFQKSFVVNKFWGLNFAIDHPHLLSAQDAIIKEIAILVLNTIFRNTKSGKFSGNKFFIKDKIKAK